MPVNSLSTVYSGVQSQFGDSEGEQTDRRKTTTFSTPTANTTTWQQQFMQHEQPSKRNTTYTS